MSVRFHQQAPISLNNRSELKKFIGKMLKANNHKAFELDIIFCDDNFILDINKRFLNHDYFTDIITFDLTEPGETLHAEIYISKDRVAENAINQLVTLRAELHRVIFHGILHLLGYDDKSKQKKKLMTQMEDLWLSKYFNK